MLVIFFRCSAKKICPVVCWNNRASIFTAQKLGEVTVCRIVYRLSDGFQAPNLGAALEKHQSGANFVWPTTRNDKVIKLCL